MNGLVRGPKPRGGVGDATAAIAAGTCVRRGRNRGCDDRGVIGDEELINRIVVARLVDGTPSRRTQTPPSTGETPRVATTTGMSASLPRARVGPWEEVSTPAKSTLRLRHPGKARRDRRVA